MKLRHSLPALLTLTALAFLELSTTVSAHDSWVETNTNLVRAGDSVHVDLKLGNHGNDHRDFKLAGKVNLEKATLQVIGPDGKARDLKSELTDVGYAPKEGYWTTKFVSDAPGLYLVAHTVDQVVSYAPTRSIKSAKNFFVASKSLDKVGHDNPGYDRILGHPLEIVPTSNPVTPMGPGEAITVRVLYKGKAMADARVSFIPRSGTLTEDFDPKYERRTDSDGRAAFTPKTGDVYLVVVHHVEPTEGGDKYESTKYSATLTVFVPQVCPCCGE